MPITFSSPTLVEGVCNIRDGNPPILGDIIYAKPFVIGTGDQIFYYTDVYGNPAQRTVAGAGSAGSSVWDSRIFIVFPGSAPDSSSYDINSGNSMAVANFGIVTSSYSSGSYKFNVVPFPLIAGSGSWTKPTGVTQVLVECWGGGGAGGGCGVNNSAGAGGGGGNYARKLLTYSSDQLNISYSVGTGGVGANAAAGTAGGDTAWDTNLVLAKGGPGGAAGVANTTVSGTPIDTTNNIGDVIYYGKNGSDGVWNGTALSATGGAGGGAAGSATDGVTGNTTGGIYNSTGDNVGERGGGGQEQTITANGVDGLTGYSAGGGGSGAARLGGSNRAGGPGGIGGIRIFYR